MSLKHNPGQPILVACDVCLTEIPESVALHPEGDEYVQHFCGTECYSRWKEQQVKERVKPE